MPRVHSGLLLAVLMFASGCGDAAPEGMEYILDPGPESTPRAEPATDPVPSEPPIAAPSPTPTSTTPPLFAFTSCVSSDPWRLCVGLNVVAYKDSRDNKVVLEDAELEALVKEVNAIWAPCDVAFQVDQYRDVYPEFYGFSFGSDAQEELNRIRRVFGNSSSFLLTVTGPWSGRTSAWTVMPGVGPFGAVLEKSAGRSAVSMAHELGHYQGLYNTDESANVMSKNLKPHSRQLTVRQCDQARTNLRYFWSQMLRTPTEIGILD